MTLERLRASLVASAGTIVFGMEDGTVSIFGLVAGVAATTTDTATVLVAGASGAAAAAVSMMAGAYLDTETSRDAWQADRAKLEVELADPARVAALLPGRLAAAGLEPPVVSALCGAVEGKPEAVKGLLFALQSLPQGQLNPGEQALWMLAADFFSAAVPIVPFMVMPIFAARFVSAGITILLLVGLGIGRAQIGNRPLGRTVVETVGMGIAAALAGVGIGLLFNRAFG